MPKKCELKKRVKSVFILQNNRNKKTTSYISSIGNALLKLFYLAGMGGQDKKNNENYFGFKITIVARNMPLCTKQSALGLRETAMAVLCPY